MSGHNCFDHLRKEIADKNEKVMMLSQANAILKANDDQLVSLNQNQEPKCTLDKFNLQ